ncbi:M12 family metallo-peptidase [Chryseobacterium fluminis]|uniref:reprolysin-like metallopeptidase n=1 Tax=Chryseobacterium fluminis TaxID=2983606 RepID=UPI00225B6EB3|nr:zinc-dependent metalloprotease family protein [Chryseobacterium sp. MMS21-Ot14]UZT95899.1 M12 family metallo-peptidase [Chryseobacterium sp. MMS21-Ot14]
MKKIFISLLLSLIGGSACAQWVPAALNDDSQKTSDSRSYYKLDLDKIRTQLAKAQETGKNAKPVEILLPTLSGKIERFAVYSFPVVVKELAEKYQLGSYVGVGIDDPSKYVRFSVAPNDFQSMMIKDGSYEFIDPQNKDKTIYRVHPKTNKDKNGFMCSTNEHQLSKKEIEDLFAKGNSFTHQPTDFTKTSDKKFRTMRLAISATGEYTAYHGGTVAGAVAAINATMTRVNGVFEKDLAVHLNVQNFPDIIYTDAASDPYTTNIGLTLQQVLTINVGNANYDIGHVFNAANKDGSAGCLGCVCTDPHFFKPEAKGSAYSQTTSPVGDDFDIDFVAHEMGHQLGAHHTFSTNLEGSGVQVEPGSGSTIMGYAGITGIDTDVQAHSDPYFHIASIKEIQTNLRNKTCDVETAMTNNPPVIAALPTYNIPKGTAFVLTASATDPENDPLTYTWEEVDNATVTTNKNNLGTTTTGATFRSVSPASSPTRYFPKLSSVLAGTLNNNLNTWESVSAVARISKFAVTVRDNHNIPTQQQTQYAEQTIVVGNDGPFKINTTQVYHNISSPVSWDVANTNAAPYNSPNVKIDYTTDNGSTWTILTASTGNDGSESFNFPAALNGQNIKLRISSIGNVFYAVKQISVTTTPICDGSAPTLVTVENITASSAKVNWSSVLGAAYQVRYKKTTDVSWQQTTSATNSITLSGLASDSKYDVEVAAVCSGAVGTYSTTKQFTTLSTITYCTIKTSSSNDEYISNVTLANINNNSGAGNYTDYGTDPAKTINLISGTNNMISVTITWTAGVNPEAVRAWIDFNRNGIFEASEMVMDAQTSSNPTVSSTFSVPVTAVLNQKLKMRVALRYNISPEACTSYAFGEVEDYNVIVSSPLTLSTVEQNDSGNDIQVYPNPTSDILYITKVSDKADFEIHNAAGQLVKSGVINNNRVQVESLITGVYIITIKDKGISKIIKFIKK